MTDPDILGAVRRSCAMVASNATFVHLQAEAIPAYAAVFPVEAARAAAADDRVSTTRVEAGSAERLAALTLASVAVNFTSGWHDVMPKRPGLSGAVSTITRLRDYEQATGAFTPQRLQAFTTTDASQVFETPIDGGALETLLELLASTLNDLGTLAGDHGGFVALIQAADCSANRLAALLAPLPSFADIADHQGLPVSFYKRAQMAAASLHREFQGTGPGMFDDIDRLTIFADNLVPHVLRLDGLLTLDPSIEASIERGELLSHGSAQEVEIRACGVHAAELLVQALADQGHSITAADVDHWLWTRGGQPQFKAHRRHRCRNPYY